MHNLTFKVAIIKDMHDNKPVVKSFTIDEFVTKYSKPHTAFMDYVDYHEKRTLSKQAGVEARIAKASGNDVQYRELKVFEKDLDWTVGKAKTGHAVMPFTFKNDVTYTMKGEGDKEKAGRDNTLVEKFSLIILDIESKVTQAQIHEALSEYEYFLWPTVTFREDDPRFRVVLFPEVPMAPREAQSLILRIDAYLPANNGPESRTNAIDGTSGDVGRLMYLPNWLVNHPVKFFTVHNTGKLLSTSSFELSAEKQSKIDERLAMVEETKKVKAQASAVARVNHGTGSTPGIVFHNGKAFLDPEYDLEHQRGFSRVASIMGPLSKVLCPLHNDAKGGEHVFLRHGVPTLRCKECGDIHMFTEGPTTLTLVKKKKNPNIDAPKAVIETVRPPRLPQGTTTLVMEEDPIIPLNDRYLPKDLLNRLPNTGLMMVKSPKGTGKTEFLKLVAEDCAKKGKSVLLLGHRVFLLKNIADRTGLDYYREIEDHGTTESMALCLNSLTRIDPFNDKPPHTVIIDESEQVFLHLISPTLTKNHSTVFNNLMWVMNHAKRIIVLDADLTEEMTFNMIKELRGEERLSDEPHIGVINTYKFEGRQTNMYSSRYHVIGELIESVEAGKRCYVATNNAHEARVLGALMTTLGIGNLLITAQSNESPECMGFIADPTGESKKYQVVIASPTAQTGISIDEDANGNPQFDIIYGLFGHLIGTFQDIDQALSRVRCCNDTRVWVQKVNHKSFPMDFKTIIERITVAEHKSRLLILGEETVDFTKGEMKWANCYSIVTYNKLDWSHEKLAKFRELREEGGYVLTDVEEDTILAEIGKDAYTTEEMLQPDGYVDEVMNAEIVEGEALHELQQKPNPAHEEMMSIQRAAQKEFLGEDFNRENLAASLKQKALRNRRKLRLARSMTAEQVREHDKMQRKVAGTVFTNASHALMEKKLRDEMCKAMGVNYDELIDRAQRVARGDDENDIEIPNGVLMEGAKFFESKKDDFVLCFNNPRFKNAVLEPKRTWDAVMGTYCLPLMTKKKGPKGAQVTKYFIDIKKHDVLLKVFNEKRGM